jgi:hypothetical protein
MSLKHQLYNKKFNKETITMRRIKLIIFLAVTVILIAEGTHLFNNKEEYTPPSRHSKIPADAEKILPENDLNPPLSESPEYHDPVPVPGLVNTAGGEDSAFVLPDGETLYFFFTPDVGVPVEEQVKDKVTGIYRSSKDGDSWGEPERIILQELGKLAMDGCQYVNGDEMYFCSAREGYTGLHWFKAEKNGNTWTNWVNIDEELKTEEHDVGELYISADGKRLYFHSTREGGEGMYDIWFSDKTGDEWGAPVNLEVVNTEGNEGWPCLSIDEDELWFSKDYGIWRTKKVNGEWTKPERMFFPLVGEPSLDVHGNVYFTHHFFKNDTMLEADIYVAYRKTS